MTMTTTMNGPVRKSLAQQIDRLDQMLDGLSEALHESITAAVKDAVGLAVKEAVQAVLTELLASPAIQEALRAGAAVPAAANHATAPTSRPTLRERLTRVRGWLGARLKAAAQAVGSIVDKVQRTAVAAWHKTRLVRRYRWQLAAALAVGAALAAATYHAGPSLAAAANGVAGFALAVLAQAGLALRRLLAMAPDLRQA
jgi:hypothetical protein